MSEHLDARACAQAELAIDAVLLGACVISVASAVDGSGSIDIEAIRLRLRDGRAARIRAGDCAEYGIILESVESVAMRKMVAHDFAVPVLLQGFGGPFAPNYRPADRCCATCDDGHCTTEGAPTWYCIKYGRRPVCEGYVCDSWTEETEEDA